MTKRRSSIPVLALPKFGKPLPQPPHARYDHRRQRRNRALVLAAEPLCRRCGSLAVEVHHRVPMSQGGHPWAFENLEPLCAACHAAAHGANRRRP